MKPLSWIGLTVAGVACLLGMPLSASAQDTHDESYHQDYVYGAPADQTEAWRIARGGRLYDNWFKTLDVPKPKTTHKAWPSSNKKTGDVTWRCKSCHGWDFKGVDGKYASGSYKTGIKGVNGVKGKDPNGIHTAIMDDTHGFIHEVIPKEDMLHLALFLSKGQYDVAGYVSDDGSVNGDVNRGRAMFQNTCAACHGFDGRALNWGDSKEPAYVGTEANANPWEVMFKIRHGHPGAEMISYAAFPMQFAADVLAYAKTLPQK